MAMKRVLQKPGVGKRAALKKRGAAIAIPSARPGYIFPGMTRAQAVADPAAREAYVRELLNEVYSVVTPGDFSFPVEGPPVGETSPLAVLKKRVEEKAAEGGGDGDGIPYAGARLDSCVEAANFVKTLRAKSGLTQKRLADISGVQQATISNIERVRVKGGPRASTLGALARACGYDFRLKIRD